jgi:hypothetical protein
VTAPTVIASASHEGRDERHRRCRPVQSHNAMPRPNVREWPGLCTQRMSDRDVPTLSKVAESGCQTVNVRALAAACHMVRSPS